MIFGGEGEPPPALRLPDDIRPTDRPIPCGSFLFLRGLAQIFLPREMISRKSRAAARGNEISAVRSPRTSDASFVVTTMTEQHRRIRISRPRCKFPPSALNSSRHAKPPFYETNRFVRTLVLDIVEFRPGT